VVTQQMNPASLDEKLPKGFKTYNPFADTASLLSASLPLTMYKLLKDHEGGPGGKAILFATDGKNTWTTCELDITDFPSWPSKPDDPNGELKVVKSVEIRALDKEELKSTITEEAQKINQVHESIGAVGLRLRPREEYSLAIMAQASTEIETLLDKQTREDDLLFRLKGTTSFGLLLRHLDKSDAEKFANRLKKVIEDDKFADEVAFDVSFEAFGLKDMEPTAFAEQIVKSLEN